MSLTSASMLPTVVVIRLTTSIHAHLPQPARGYNSSSMTLLLFVPIFRIYPATIPLPTELIVAVRVGSPLAYLFLFLIDPGGLCRFRLVSVLATTFGSVNVARVFSKHIVPCSMITTASI